MYESFSIIFSIAALLSYINYRWLKLPSTVGQLILALGVAFLMLLLKPLFPTAYDFFCKIIIDTDFSNILLEIMLGFLLFAGALHVDINELKKEKWSILLFATIGVLISTFLVGSGLYFLAQLLQCDLPYIHCLLFGALISPTDPIAVLSILKSTKISKSLQLKIEGESLFNDGIGVIVFTGVLLFANMGEMGNEEGDLFLEIGKLFAEEVLLGLALGGALGWIAYKLMKSVETDKFLTTVLSLAVVFGGTSLASMLHTSAPLAMVVAGLLIGNKIKYAHFDKSTKEGLTGFWNILDESLNGVLFVMLGFAVHLILIESTTLLLAILTIVLVLLIRFISVSLPYSLLKHSEHSWLKTTYMLTWGGLRGGISLALAFSLSPELSRENILLLTYCVVIFSILIQGLTISKLTEKLYP